MHSPPKSLYRTFQPSRNFFHSLSQASFPHRGNLSNFYHYRRVVLLWSYQWHHMSSFTVGVLSLNTLFLRIDHTAHSSLLLISIPLYKYTKFVYPFFCELFGLFGLFSSYYYEYNCYDSPVESFYKHIFSCLLHKYLRVEFLDDRVGLDLPRISVVKTMPANVGDVGSGRSPGGFLTSEASVSLFWKFITRIPHWAS